jgi:hypothetical protein
MLAVTGGRGWFGLALGVLGCSYEGSADPSDASHITEAQDGTSCEGQTNASSAAIGAAVDAADRSCSRDSDCVLIGLSSACWHGCGAVVSSASKPQLESIMDEQSRTACAGFTTRDCTLVIPPCVSPGSAACIAGECSGFVGDAPSGMTEPPRVVNNSVDGSAVELAVSQRLELRLQSVGPGSYRDPQLSTTSLRFAQSLLPRSQNPGGPTQIYVFQGVSAGTVQLTIPHSVRADPFKLTVTVR